ncbi:endonuclease/exonuclease/phosphatase family protein [Lentisphaera marina]|uniref:endonuclease/exonuclease/phosphatase family protein n=1 Tax=Lentisphaera marina TaxID=1111041 RepID=UPI0023672F6D|nr:endonuclease/exonuclease/phosphatase family protein [Lentisphaera marina]MDD7983549.1 endonuclease/exonuclease/phosphatase family protein [Lentisphaera marina]
MNIRSLTIFLTFVQVLASCAYAQTEAPIMKVMSYNIHRGGTVHLKQPLSQTAKAIKLAKADIVGIQEPRSPKGFTTKKLAELLGWNHSANIRKGIILTPYEIVKNLDNGIKVKLPTGQEAYVFSLHLPSHPYQPYQLLGIRPSWHKHTNDIEFIKTEAEAIQWAKKARGELISDLLKQISELPDNEAPVFVVGDFNEPSHLDWTEAAAKAGRHPIKVAYPTSSAMVKAGFKDSYRVIYPDEMKNPGLTWSPKYKADDPTTHLDRIDFVYFKGKNLKVTDVKIVGENKEKADIVISPYPSDHRAVVATFTLAKQADPKKPQTRDSK